MTVGIIASAHVETGGVTYDTFTAVASTYGGATNEGGTSVTLGMSNWQRINSGQTLTVHGVRWWRTTQNQTIAPTVGLAIMGAAALRTQASAVGTGSVAAGWEQVLFATPYTLNTNDNFVCWVNVRSGGYPATTSPFSDGQDSQLGLYQISGTAAPGRFIYTTNPALEPTGGSGSIFWVEPLVTLA